MRKWLLASTIALAAALAFLAVARAQTDRSGAAKANAKGAAFDAHDLTGIWNPAPFMQPKGEVNPLDLGGHPRSAASLHSRGRGEIPGQREIHRGGRRARLRSIRRVAQFFYSAPV